MASMMLCLDVFSSLSINLSIASKLAMQTSHSFGSALAFAASPVASSPGRRAADMQYVTLAGRNAFSCATRVPALNAALTELNKENVEVDWVAVAGTACALDIFPAAGARSSSASADASVRAVTSQKATSGGSHCAPLPRPCRASVMYTV